MNHRLVIPAKAGIHFDSSMDSGLRRNDDGYAIREV